MSARLLLPLLLSFLFCFSCDKSEKAIKRSIDCKNQKAYEFRGNCVVAVEKAEEALADINTYMPRYIRGKAMAWNNLATAYFLQNKCDLANAYIDSVKNITSDYPDKQLEDDIAWMISARICAYKRDLSEEWEVYLNRLQLFQIADNKKDLLQHPALEKLDELQRKRYFSAKSEFYFGLLRIAYCADEKKRCRENIFDTAILPHEYLDSYQIQELLMRHSYYCYLSAVDANNSLPQRTEALNRCMTDFKAWLELLDEEIDPQHITNFYEQFVRVVNADGLEFLIKSFARDDQTFKDIKDNICRRIGCEPSSGLDEISVRLLEESIRLSEKYKLSNFDIAWYNLQLGHYYHTKGNTAKSEEYFTKYTDIEKEYIRNSNPKRSLRIYKINTPGYYDFLAEKSEKDAAYKELSELFRKEENENFHDDRVLLDKQASLYRQIRAIKRAGEKASRIHTISFVCLSAITALFVILYVRISWDRKILASLFADHPDMLSLAEKRNAFQKQLLAAVKKILKRLTWVMLILILFFVLVLCVVFHENLSEYIALLSVLVTILSMAISILLIPKVKAKEWFERIKNNF